MNSWKRIMGITAVFAALAMVAAAGQASRQGARNRANPQRQMRLVKQSAPLVAKALAKALSLSNEQTEKLADAYVEETVAQTKKMAEIMQSGDREKMRAAFKERRAGMQKALEGAIGAEKAQKASQLILTGLDRSIQALLRPKGADTAKVEKALPVLVKYHQQLVELFGKMRSGGANRQEIMGKLKALRETTTKELTPIIGEEAATAWQKRGGMRGMRPRRPAGQGAGQGRRGGGAGAGGQ